MAGFSEFISLSFSPEFTSIPEFCKKEVYVYYGFSDQLTPYFKNIEKYMSKDEKIRAGKFHFDNDRNTYSISHGLLRLILSEVTGDGAAEMQIISDKNNKPRLNGNKCFFNLSHSYNVFAFVISKYFYAGIDIEKIKNSIDYIPIINSYFGEEERKYILESTSESVERFFLLWTRKEALLKAVGTGMIENLSSLDVSGNNKKIDLRVFENMVQYPLFNDIFIYSKKIEGFFLSLAVPQISEVVIKLIDENNIWNYLK